MTVRTRRVGDVLKLERRAVTVDPLAEYDEIGVRSFGQGIFHKEPVTGSALGNKRVFEIHPGDLVLSNVFAWEGAIALAEESERGRIGSHRFMTYVPNSTEVDPSYVRYFLLSEPGLALINHASPGSAGRNKTLAIDRFEALEIPLPNVAEQRRAAAKLDRVLATAGSVADRAGSSAERLAATTAAWLHQVFAVGQFPMERLGELGEVRRGKGPAYDNGSVIVAINQACVRWNGVDMKQARDVSAIWEQGVPDTARVRANDVLVNSTGEGTIGRAAVATSEHTGLIFDSHVLAVTTEQATVVPAFLVLFLRSPQGQDAIENAKSANTTKQTELGKGKLEEMLVPTPDPSLQHEIVARFERFNSALSAAARMRMRSQEVARALTASALNHTFAGLL